MDYQDEVVKWKLAASALHRGALNNCEKFKFTEDAINYLCSYQEGQHKAVHPGTVTRQHHNYHYHSDNLPGRVGLSNFFWNRVANCCVLCKYVRMTQTGVFLHKMTDNVNPESIPDGELNLRRLEHLAVMHTPYFVMLFLDLVEKKRYGFHKNGSGRHCIANYVFERLTEDGEAFGEEEDSFRFLKLWWRFQDRRSSRELNISIPSYLELHKCGKVWNSRIDTFANRKPEPLYNFLATSCLCHDISSTCSVTYSSCDSVLPVMSTVSNGQVSTFSFRVLVPRLHIEDILHSVVRACNTRRTLGCDTYCSSMSEPRLDCLALEDVDHPKAVMVHVVTTLNSRWQTLNSWMISMQGKPLDSQLSSNINRVFLGGNGLS